MSIAATASMAAKSSVLNFLVASAFGVGSRSGTYQRDGLLIFDAKSEVRSRPFQKMGSLVQTPFTRRLSPSGLAFCKASGSKASGKI